MSLDVARAASTSGPHHVLYPFSFLCILSLAVGELQGGAPGECRVRLARPESMGVEQLCWWRSSLGSSQGPERGRPLWDPTGGISAPAPGHGQGKGRVCRGHQH